MEPIRVRGADRPGDLVAIVGGPSDETTHRVHLDPGTLERLGRPGETPEDFVQRCFAFLLAREPKESILPSFDVEVIGRYFPEFEQAMAEQGRS